MIAEHLFTIWGAIIIRWYYLWSSCVTTHTAADLQSGQTRHYSWVEQSECLTELSPITRQDHLQTTFHAHLVTAGSHELYNGLCPPFGSGDTAYILGLLGKYLCIISPPLSADLLAMGALYPMCLLATHSDVKLSRQHWVQLPPPVSLSPKSMCLQSSI